MGWETSTRRQRLPPGWSSTIVPRVLRRDQTCRLGLPGCSATSTEVDHIGADTDHRDHMLRGVCRGCHAQRTQEQAKEAQRLNGRRRPTERHPGAA